MPTAYLSLGANLGDRAKNLQTALQLLAQGGVVLLRVSSFYETAPVGGPSQPPYLNLVAEVKTDLAPRALLALCQRIEHDLGRVRAERWGPRTLDIDLLLYADVTLQDSDLTLPHPRLTERQFVLVPLAEIAADLLLPDGRPVRELTNPADDGIRYWGAAPNGLGLSHARNGYAGEER